jgi:hypothetical protein
MIQVMDVGINKPFKDYVKQEYEKFMVENIEGKPSRLDVAKWIAAGWENVKEESILNTWNSIGIVATQRPVVEDNEESIAEDEEECEHEEETLIRDTAESLVLRIPEAAYL